MESKESLAREATDLMEWFRRMRSDRRTKHADGSYHVYRLGGQAAKLAFRAWPLIYSPSKVLWPPSEGLGGAFDSPIHRDLAWEMTWLWVCIVIRSVGGLSDARLPDVGSLGEINHKEWRKRCLDFADVCEWLADRLNSSEVDTSENGKGERWRISR